MRKPCGAQRPRHQRERAVAGEEPGHQQHRVAEARAARRGGVRRRRGAPVAGGPERVAPDLGTTALPSRSTAAGRGRSKPSGSRKSARRWSRHASHATGSRRTRGYRSRLVQFGLGGPASRSPADWTCCHASTGTHRRPPPVAVSEELFAPVGRGIELCYQTFGDPDDDPLLLVMGLGGPMTWWDAELCEDLARAGFFVVRYDNRDTGRSTDARRRGSRAIRWSARSPARRCARRTRIADLADDAFGLLDHLGSASAHVVGVSMGGMIAQTMAIAAPERVRSLTSIMSTTGQAHRRLAAPRRCCPMLLAPAQARAARRTSPAARRSGS